MSYLESRYNLQSAELSKLDYSGRSRIRVKLTSTPELLNTPDTPETKWLSLSAPTARKVADAIIDGARDDATAVTEPVETSEYMGAPEPFERGGAHSPENLYQDAVFLATAHGRFITTTSDVEYWMARAKQTREFMVNRIAWSQQEETIIVRRYA